MSRLELALHRLYPPSPPGHTQWLMLEVAAPAEWAALGEVWRGVQADLGLPAPAIAVSGTDGLQLWFSLQQPLAVPQALAFLTRLQARYLPALPPARVRLRAEGPRPPIPAEDPRTGQWSAFVAPDLAPVFADTPWLDIAPSPDGQADLLARVAPIPPAAWEAAWQALAPSPAAAPVTAPVTAPVRAAARLDPRDFLQGVLDDDSAPLALRVEAAKALLAAR